MFKFLIPFLAVILVLVKCGQFKEGDLIETWTVDSLKNIKEHNMDVSYWTWLTNNGFNPSNYMKYDVNVYYVKFNTQDEMGRERQTGMYVSIPIGATGPLPIALTAYGTKFGSIHRDTYLSTMWATRGMITITPHNLGTQTSALKAIEPYFIASAYQKLGFDALLKVKEVLIANNIAFTDKLLLAGHSEGGYSVTAMAKHFQEIGIPVTMVAILAAPTAVGYYVLGGLSYNTTWWPVALTTVKYFLTTSSYIVDGVSLNTGNIYQNESASLKIRRNFPLIFKQPFADLFADAYLDPENQEAKLAAIENEYKKLPPSNVLLPMQILHPNLAYGLFTQQYNHPTIKFYFEQSVDKWTPLMDFNIYAGTADVNVPYQLSVYQYYTFLGYGATKVYMTTYPGLDHYQPFPNYRKEASDKFFSLIH